MELVEFKILKDPYMNTMMKVTGWRVGDLAILVDGYVYGIRAGRKVCNLRMDTLNDAKKFAHFIGERYQSYFNLWEFNPDADIIKRGSNDVEDGKAIHKTVEELDGKRVSYRDIMNQINEFRQS